MRKEVVSNIEKQNTVNLIKAGKRLDGRAFDEYRPIKIEVGIYERAEGSARVQIGNTVVAAGIKVGEGTPYPDSPNSGVLSSNAELAPLASPVFQAGPPGPETIELARVMDRGIRESKMIDLEALCIEPGEKIRMVYVDAYVLDYAGNPIDAAALAATTALHHATLAEGEKLPVSKKPVANTFIKVAGNILLDPSLEEEHVADTRLTITIEENDNVCAMQKGIAGSWTVAEVMQCVKIAMVKTKELRALIP